MRILCGCVHFTAARLLVQALCMLKLSKEQQGQSITSERRCRLFDLKSMRMDSLVISGHRRRRYTNVRATRRESLKRR